MIERSCRDIAKKHLFVLCCSQCLSWLIMRGRMTDGRQGGSSIPVFVCLLGRRITVYPEEAYREDMGTLFDGRAAYGRAKER